VVDHLSPPPAPAGVDLVVTTIFLMVMLNGYPSLPDGFILLYLGGAIGLVAGLSLLIGWVSKKLEDTLKIPIFAGGPLIGATALVLLPVSLVSLTFTLLGAFGMLSW